MSTDLVVLNNQTAVTTLNQAPEEDLTGIGGIRSKPGNIVLIQPTTINSYGGKPGQFLDTFDNSVYDSITVVPLRLSNSRSYFPEGETTSRAPLCGSNDGLVPRPTIEHPVSSQCGYFAGMRFVPKCQKAMWIGGKKPACSDQRRMFCVIKDTGLPAFVTIGGLSINPYETGINHIKKDMALNREKGLSLKLYDYYFTLKSERAQGKTVFYLTLADVKRVLNPGEYSNVFQDLVVNYKTAQDVADKYSSAEGAVDNAVGGVVDAEFVDQQPYQAA